MVVVVFVTEEPWPAAPDAAALTACIWLGVGPTAVATLVYFRLIARAGPTFMSLVNYMSPIVAVSAGAILLDEPLRPAALMAMVLILAGIAIATRWDAARRGRGTASESGASR
jgi:drug/metabolite transporter (DMT)-like permease